jgi:hypothetical protein
MASSCRIFREETFAAPGASRGLFCPRFVIAKMSFAVRGVGALFPNYN